MARLRLGNITDELFFKSRHELNTVSTTKKRFGTKMGIMGGAIYMTTQAGLWGDSSKTEQIYKDLYTITAPYIKDSVVEVPELPRTSDMMRSLTQTWNRGVISTTDFLIYLPSHLANWTSTAYSKINELVSDPQPPNA